MRSVSWSHFCWPLLLGCTVFAASSRPVVSGLGFEGGDKVAHFAVYGLLGTLLCRAWGSGWRAAVLALATASLFGATDEWHQSFVPGRDSDVLDWLADSSGAALAVCDPVRAHGGTGTQKFFHQHIAGEGAATAAAQLTRQGDAQPRA